MDASKASEEEQFGNEQPRLLKRAARQSMYIAQPIDFSNPIPSEPVLNTTSSRHSSDPQASNKKTIKLEFVLSSATRVDCMVSQETTVMEIKHEVSETALRLFGISLDPVRGLDIKVPGANFLADPRLQIATLPYVINSRQRGRIPIFLVLDKKSDISKEYKNENVTIGANIGHALTWNLKDEEITEFRQAMAKQRYDDEMAAIRRELMEPTNDQKPLESDTLNISATLNNGTTRFRGKSVLPTNVVTPSHSSQIRSANSKVPDGLSKAPSTPLFQPNGTHQTVQKHLLKLRHQNGTFSTVAANLNVDTADIVIAKCFNSLGRASPELTKGKAASDFVLKPIGLATYIHGSTLIKQFKAIADDVTAKRETQVDLLERAPLELETDQLEQMSFNSKTKSLEERLWEYTDVSASYVHSHITVDRWYKSGNSDLWKKQELLSSWDIFRPISIRILGVDNLFLPNNIQCNESLYPNLQISLRCGLYEGTTSIAKSIWGGHWVSVSPPPASSNSDPPQQNTGNSTSNSNSSEMISSTVMWPASKAQVKWIGTPLIRNLPRATQVCFSLVYRTSPNDDNGIPIAWANKSVFDYKHELAMGNSVLPMWKIDKEKMDRLGIVNPRGTSRPHYTLTQRIQPNLYISFESYHLPIVFPNSLSEAAKPKPFFPSSKTLTSQDYRTVSDIEKGYPIDTLTSKQKHFLWTNREVLKPHPKLLPKFLQSIPYDCYARLEAHRLLELWDVTGLAPSYFMEMLDAKFADPVIRAYAVNKLGLLSDDDIGDFLLQLIQALRYEPYLDCALTRLLLRRAAANPTLGHFLFWYLKSEIHNEETFERNGLLLEAYLRSCTPFQRHQITLQTKLVEHLMDISTKINLCDKDKVALLKQELTNLNLTFFNNPALAPPQTSTQTSAQPSLSFVPSGASVPTTNGFTTNPSRMTTFSGISSQSLQQYADASLFSPPSKLGSPIGSSPEETLSNPSSPRFARSPIANDGNLNSLPNPSINSSRKATMLPAANPIKVKLPLNPLVEVSGFITEKCKVMKSKKEPLWLCFQNTDAKSGPYITMFKAGDDLRQDMLVLQLFRIMDRLWRANDLYLDMAIYNVLATGDQCGFVEIVTQSKTISELQGLSAFKDEVLFDFLLSKNGTLSDSKQLNSKEDPRATIMGQSYSSKSPPRASTSQRVSVASPPSTVSSTAPVHPMILAIERFCRSCAAYCVATYVLGIGDRHNGNVMVRENGILFHIDFGHMLGNFKEKLGIKRERVPFVFTPEMVFVMGDKTDGFYNKFVEMACRAYNLLREQAPLFMNLFAMMMSSGMPELQSDDDLQYLKYTLDLDLTEDQASRKLADLIEASTKALSTRVNWFIHNLAQKLK